MSWDGEEGGQAGFQVAGTACMTHALGGTHFHKNKGYMCPEGKQGWAHAGPVESCSGIGTYLGAMGSYRRSQSRSRIWTDFWFGKIVSWAAGEQDEGAMLEAGRMVKLFFPYGCAFLAETFCPPQTLTKHLPCARYCYRNCRYRNGPRISVALMF